VAGSSASSAVTGRARAPRSNSVLARPELYQAKLRALARDSFGIEDGTPGGFPGGATLLSPDGRTGLVLAEDQANRALGGALTWAWSVQAAEVHVLAPADAAGALARRAQAFSHPPVVHVVTGRDVSPAAPSPLPTYPPLPPDAEPFVELFARAGAEPVVEQGALVAEVLGLEVARVVDGELEVGVGKHDREAQKLMHGDRQPFDALVDTVTAVRELRRAGVPTHPMNQLAASRWLRAVVCARPSLVGAAQLAPVSSTVARADLRLPAPAPAAGFDTEGRPMVVVCSTGIDVDLVPTAADQRMAGPSPDARLVLVVPEADAHQVTRDLAAALKEPAEIVTVPADWRGL
jgi:hypothetical protein